MPNSFFINKFNEKNLFSSINVAKKFIHLIFKYSILYLNFLFYNKTYSNIFLSNTKRYKSFTNNFFFIKVVIKTTQKTTHDDVRRVKKKVIYPSKLWCFKFNSWIIFIRYFFQPLFNKNSNVEVAVTKKLFSKPFLIKKKILDRKYFNFFTRNKNAYNF